MAYPFGFGKGGPLFFKPLIFRNVRCIMQRMARSREYDTDSVLDAAVRTFWKRGYEGTSIRDLVRACGLTTRSMYDAFGGKEGFFEAALNRYHENVLSAALAVLQKGHGLHALERFVNLLAENGTADGCLFINTAAERNLVGRSAIRRVEQHMENLHLLIREKLEQARADGLFAGDSEARATQFCVSVAGFMMSLKCGLSRERAAVALRLPLKDIAGS